LIISHATLLTCLELVDEVLNLGLTWLVTRSYRSADIFQWVVFLDNLLVRLVLPPDQEATRSATNEAQCHTKPDPDCDCADTFILYLNYLDYFIIDYSE